MLREQELRLAHSQQEAAAAEEEARLLREELRATRDQRDELETSLLLFDAEQKNRAAALEKKAELLVDERFKAKHEAIKCYFDASITKILMCSGGSNNERVVELGREVLALKLVNERLEGQLVAEQSETQALGLTLAHYKEQHSLLEQKIREGAAKNA